MELLTKASYSSEVNEREKKNLQVAYEAACESVVLLENDGTLPLTTKKVAMYGPGVSMTIKGGTGSGEVNERHSVSILEGMKTRGFEVTTGAWLGDFAKYYEEAEEAYRQKKKKRINIFKLKSIMDMLFDDFRRPAGPAITNKYITPDTDTCIYVVSRQAGESGDRKLEKGDYYLSDEEYKAISVCAKAYDKFVLIINGGAPIDTSFTDEIDGINAVLYIGQLGTEGGHAVADVLSGKVSPSGKLTDTWAKNYEDFPFAMEYSYLNGNLKDEYYKEGIYVGYRYFDSFGIEPAYPFGYGLSYTEFSSDCEKVNVLGHYVSIDARVKNTGTAFSGKEVLQLYVSPPKGSVDREYQTLVAFTKTGTLAPGQEESISLKFDLSDIAFYSEDDASYVLEKGDYILRLGNSSRNTKVVGIIFLDREVIISTHTHICPIPDEMQSYMKDTLRAGIQNNISRGISNDSPGQATSQSGTTPATTTPVATSQSGTTPATTTPVATSQVATTQATTTSAATTWTAPNTDQPSGTSSVPHLVVSGDTFTTIHHTYEKPKLTENKKVKDFVDTLSLEEMSDMVVGIGMFGGTKHFHLPGAAGNTTSRFWDRGLVNVTLCDGPAGLRIQKRSTVNKKGKVKAVEMSMSVFEYLPNFIKKFMVGNPEKHKVLYQYTTAFPVTAALAQSWNTELFHKVGQAVLREMKEYGCTFWLAPAVNIHRNPLCGRNFEYYSEDPYLAGTLAASITRGIQSEEGYYATIKHFACNNQEDNRTHMSANVTERALREIYLKPFQIAIKSGGVKSVMTSYNKLNDVYTVNSHDLCTKVLRNEWHFKGVVMSDWYSTGRDKGDDALAMKAGNDLIMPGGKSFKNRIINGVKTGKISEEDLRRCCENVVEAVITSALQKEYIDKRGKL